MKLRKLLKNISIPQVKGSRDVEISGICANSKVVAPGNLFIAKKGSQDDGNRYISEAVAAGCVAVLTDIFDPFLEGVTQLITPNVAALEGDLATQYYACPSDLLYTVGITGTNGKTITSYLVKHLLDRCGVPSGLMGTIEYNVGRACYTATRTTPDVSTNHKLLREMVTNGCKGAVMEVTSHGLVQGRTSNISFDAAIFTNLTLDHLDYHGDMEGYSRAKAKLFASLEGKDKVAIVNMDDAHYEEMLKDCSVKVLRYGVHPGADLRAENVQLSQEQSIFDLVYGDERLVVHWPLIGGFNISNYLAAAAVGVSKGWTLAAIVEGLQDFPGVKGRLEELKNDLGIKLYVDFAHTDDALKNVLTCLGEVQKGKIITVFGCGGCRDASKRPKMAAVAEKYSILTVVTSDNPRKENPLLICEEIAKGFKKKKSFIIEVDRREAIRIALMKAKPGDIVLVAGKGHEGFQVFAHKTIEFDDMLVAEELCEELAVQKGLATVC